jgi:hypothetical protein
MTLDTSLISYSVCHMHKQLSKILEADLYVGISGVELQFDHMDLGDGLRLSKTDAHLLAPYMMVFDTNITGARSIPQMM